jgi:tryptophan synthase alpha chain
MADGPVIQRACERALARGTSLTRVLEIVREFRRQDADTPLVLMGYMNPVEAFGLERFALEARSSGVDGVLLVDLAVEEAEANAAVLRAAQLDVIFLAAPTTDDARLAAIARAASGYLYYVSLKGITGAGHLDVAQVADKLAQIRRHSALPIAVGFGVRDAQTAAAVGEVADGVVVGSALVAEVEKHGGDLPALHAALGARLSAMRAALAVRCAEAVAS